MDKRLFSFDSDHSGQEGDNQFLLQEGETCGTFFSPQPCRGRNGKTAVKYLIAFGRLCISYRSLVSIIMMVFAQVQTFFFVDVAKMSLRHKKSPNSRSYPTEERHHGAGGTGTELRRAYHP